MATFLFKSERAYVEAYVQGWRPLKWEAFKVLSSKAEEGMIPAKLAGLRMAPPQNILRKAHSEGGRVVAVSFKWKIVRRPCGCCTMAVVVGEIPRQPAHEWASAAIEAALGPRPILGAS